MKIYERNCERKRLALLAKVNAFLSKLGIADIFCYQGKIRAAKWTYLYSPQINLLKPQFLHCTGCAHAAFSIPITIFLSKCCTVQKSISFLESILWVVRTESETNILCIFLSKISFFKVFCYYGKWTGFDGSASPPSKPYIYFAEYIFMSHNQMLCTWQFCDGCGKVTKKNSFK